MLVLYFLLFTLPTPALFSYQLCPDLPPCLPCPVACLTCSAPTACSSCSIAHYLVSTTCTPCLPHCQSCTNSSTCTLCIAPYVLSDTNTSCQLCLINNAIACATTVSATSCEPAYYLLSNYCQSCLLLCQQCTSSSSCTQCSAGYYLNATVLTCNSCPAGCATCNQYNPTSCLSCSQGYQLSNNNCTRVSCTVSNCVYCSSAGVCKQCISFYYWDGSTCTMAASVTCQLGAAGPLPTQCVNVCSKWAVQVIVSGGFRCQMLPYATVAGVQYFQTYLYAYNDIVVLQRGTNTNAALTIESNMEYSYPMTRPISLTLPSYYRIIIMLKYSSNSVCGLTLSATTPSTTQTQSATLPGSVSVTNVKINTLMLHSSNLRIAPSSSFNLVQLLLRVYTCSEGCQICLNTQLCQLCASPNYMLSYQCVPNCNVYYHYTPNMTCLASCPSGYYYEDDGPNAKYCPACLAPCSTCINATSCLSCVSGTYYYNYTCSLVCPSQYYPSPNWVCQLCVSPCRTCINITTCQSCSAGFWDGTVCSKSCPSGTFPQESTHSCRPCTSPCLTCSLSATTCLSCIPGYLFSNSQCLSSCPNRYYPTPPGCTQCQAPCYTCLSDTLCLSCASNYLLNQACVATCPAGYYPNITSSRCLACSSACLTCSKSPAICSSCATGCLYEASCMPNCPSQIYYKGTIVAGAIGAGTCICLQCPYPCGQCANATWCLSCLGGYYQAGACHIECPFGTYGNLQLATCVTCTASYNNCQRCSSTACTSCHLNYLLFNGSCITNCPNYYYQQNANCFACIAPCLSCLSSSQCLSCNLPYILSQTACVIQCPTGLFAQLQHGISQCSACQSPCRACTTSATTCTYCLYGFYLYNSSCFANCSSILPVNTYYAEPSTASCSPCVFPCLQCTSPTACLSCRIGYLDIVSAKCRQCTTGTYPGSNSICLPCPISCSLCFSATFCTQCISSSYLYQNTCVSSASTCLSNGYYPAGNICYPCMQPCLTCQYTASNCTNCLNGYIYLAPNACVTACPAGTYMDSTTCLACSPECRLCVGGSHHCRACNTGYVQNSLDSTCVATCPAKTYLQGGTVCVPCRYPCETCAEQSICLSCINGVLFDGTCYSGCQSSFYASTQMACLPCSSPCSQCVATAQSCTQCIRRYWLLDSQCLRQCPSTYFGQPQSSFCLKCVGLCLTCSSYINCTTCKQHLLFYQDTVTMVGQCVTACTVGYYAGVSACLSCVSLCLTCDNFTSCVLCKAGKVQEGGVCVTQCPGGKYANQGICQNCRPPCLNCASVSTCTSCADPNDLLVASASCVVGPTCPAGYFKLESQSVCNSRCPAGYYHLRNRTCSNRSCDINEFMTIDMNCVDTCPQGFQGNSSAHCVACIGDCQGGLYYSLSSAILQDSLYLYILFTEVPVCKIEPVLQLVPSFSYSLKNENRQTLVNKQLQSEVTLATWPTNVTLLLDLKQSIQSTAIEVSFTRALETFINPLQQSNQSIVISGYDYYPSTLPSLSFVGSIALLCAVVGLANNFLMTDYAQTLFLLGLINYHYPRHLASLLEAAGLAHLHALVQINQLDMTGTGKFLYVADLGLLSNTAANFIVLAAFLGLSLLLLIATVIIRRATNYQKIDHEGNPVELDSPGANLESPDNNVDRVNVTTDTTGSSLLLRFANLMESLFSNFNLFYLNRLIYFNYTALILFSFAQLTAFTTNSTINLASSLLAIAALLFLLIYAVKAGLQEHKYWFLYGRKTLIAGAIVISMKNAIYGIGIISVCNFTAAILILTHKIEQYRVETWFHAACELIQLLILVVLSLLIMAGEGRFTTIKLGIAWLIVTAVIALLFVYLAHASLEAALYYCLHFKGVDYRSEWVSNETSSTENGSDSESNTNSLKQKEQLRGRTSLLPSNANLETLLIQIKSDQRQPDRVQPGQKKGEKGEEQPEEQFWTYGEDESEKKQGGQDPPQLLVRCVNEFSDFAASEDSG